MEIFFTSDLHFHHSNVIQYCNRPFSDVQEMNEGLIERWNSVVRHSDLVWILGDFCFANSDVANKILQKLKGTKCLIWGNHDSRAIRKLDRWASSLPYKELKIGHTNLTLCHYALKVWNKSHYGALMLYGHSHGTLPGNNQSLDVGVDCWDYRPVTLGEITERLETLPPYRSEDRHVAK